MFVQFLEFFFYFQLENSGYFHMGQIAELSHSRYYVLRLPFVYQNSEKLHKKPISTPTTCGTLLPNAIQVYPK
uniref:Secreted protein n=1 Tax=Bursaphelenchus xylophilus TaxID=6326 RepID=A0A1I7SJK0_BURXY